MHGTKSFASVVGYHADVHGLRFIKRLLGSLHPADVVKAILSVAPLQEELRGVLAALPSNDVDANAPAPASWKQKRTRVVTPYDAKSALRLHYLVFFCVICCCSFNLTCRVLCQLGHSRRSSEAMFLDMAQHCLQFPTPRDIWECRDSLRIPQIQMYADFSPEEVGYARYIDPKELLQSLLLVRG